MFLANLILSIAPLNEPVQLEPLCQPTPTYYEMLECCRQTWPHQGPPPIVIFVRPFSGVVVDENGCVIAWSVDCQHQGTNWNGWCSVE